MPITYLLWGEDTLITNHDVEASTYRQLEQDESDHDNMNRGRIRQNVARLITRD